MLKENTTTTTATTTTTITISSDKKSDSESVSIDQDHNKEEKKSEMKRQEVMDECKMGRREKLRRLSADMASQVCIPDTWGQENLLENWADPTCFTTAYMPAGLDSAREALTDDSRQNRNTSLIRLENTC